MQDGANKWDMLNAWPWDQLTYSKVNWWVDRHKKVQNLGTSILLGTSWFESDKVNKSLDKKLYRSYRMDFVV